MNAGQNKNDSKMNVWPFKTRSEEETKQLLDGKDKISTQRAAAGALRQFTQFLQYKRLPNIEDITVAELNGILYKFYSAMQPQRRTEDYSVQSIKCIRSGLSRHFRKELGVDIAKDALFVQANEMFKAITVEAKKKGKGVKQLYPQISQLDLERIAEYFAHDHVTTLQQNMIFDIIYYFCSRGRENLYTMKRITSFKLITKTDGSQYVVQHIDELDKNHGPGDSTKTNEGRMYATGGKKYLISSTVLNKQEIHAEKPPVLKHVVTVLKLKNCTEHLQW